MDRSWVSIKNRTCKEYENGVEAFLRFALEYGCDSTRMICPCKDCCYSRLINVDEVREHLIYRGINSDYTRWIWHGEKSVATDSTASEEFVHGTNFDVLEDYDDRLNDMIDDIEGDLANDPDKFLDMVNNAKMPLYSGCTRFTKLSALLKLYNLKARHGWSDSSFGDMLELIKEILPKDNSLPVSTYEAKKILRSTGMNYERIHACINDCVLYRNEHANKDKCPNPDCGESRYKKQGVPAKVLWYFPIIQRFRRLFGNLEDAKKLTWHADERVKDGKIRHPADSSQWRKIDELYPQFGKEARNLRLALSTDGMNPHGNMSTSHSTWPVVLMIYNLPPSLCIKRKYLMLSMLISGPRQPGFEIDVYLAPLIEDLKLLWGEGIKVLDVNRRENFRLRAMLFCTINDFPAYGNLAGCSVKGYVACPICGKDTCSCRLSKSGKNVYLGYRKFLATDHPYRRLCKAFIPPKAEEGSAPTPLSGEEVLSIVKDIDVRFGKATLNNNNVDGWKKRSIFFDLPYWKDLPVRHCLDVMHIEKNICDSLIGTLLNQPGKTKDGLKARQDYVDMDVRAELQPQTRGGRTFLPPACYTLSKKEKTILCEFLSKIKVPDGYSSNISSLVSMKDLKLVGLKSHDCHVLMQQLLPVAIRSILPSNVRKTVTRLCFFFKKICSKVIDLDELKSLQTEIAVVLCQMEMYFPPSFFDIMVHLSVHLVREIELCGPVYLRWMYPFERYMKILKGYVMNRQYPEGCIVERYIVEEAAEFCANYLSNVEAIGLPRVRDLDGDLNGRGTLGYEVVTIQRERHWNPAHLYVLYNIEEVQPYVVEHMTYVRTNNPRKTEYWIAKEHNKTFIDWFKTRVAQQLISGEEISKTLKALHRGPKFQVFSYSGFVINNCTFHTKALSDKCKTQNCGVSLEAQAMHISSVKDKNPTYANMSYYGIIEKIWVLLYSHEVKIPVFYCTWVDSKNGVYTDELGFTSVDLNKVGHEVEPFILASQATQIFFVPDLVDSRRSIMF